MGLLEQINEDLKMAMKAKDQMKMNVIRMVKSEAQMEKIKKKKDELTDSEMIDVISRQIKMRKDGIEEFKKAGRDDLVSQNESEILVLNKYMPKQLSIDEVNEVIEDAFAKLKPTSPKDMGLIMKEIMPKLKGKADMGYVNQKVKEMLQ